MEGDRKGERGMKHEWIPTETGWSVPCLHPVSYTHLDVYKRQVYGAEQIEWEAREVRVA